MATEKDMLTIFLVKHDGASRINCSSTRTTTTTTTGRQLSSVWTTVRRWSQSSRPDVSTRPGKLLRVTSCPFRQVTGNFLFLLFVLIVIVSRTTAAIGEAVPQIIKGVSGEQVDIPCILNSRDTDCGKIHNVKWYEDGNRVYVYSASYGYSLSEGRLQPDRAVFLANNTPPVLRINSVELEDEGSYRCDVTYVTLRSGCPTVSTAELKTIAKPSTPEIFLDDLDDDSRDGRVTSTTVGPFYEGEMISLTCEATGGKPAARVTWWNGTQSLGGLFTEDAAAEDGTGTGRNVIQLRVTRSDLMARYDCQVTHEALEGALLSWIQMDVYVPPLSLEMEVDGKTQVFEGETVTLSCRALQANPAATITWYNGSSPMEKQPESQTVQPEEGGTFASYSTLTFVASRYDDGEVFACHASNKATTEGLGMETPSQSVPIIVYYSPVVQLLPDVMGELQLNETDTLRLECLFEANPANISDVIWLRNGEPYRPSDGAIIVAENEDIFDDGDGVTTAPIEEGRFHYVIERISRHDAGQFQCSVSNVAGTGVSDNTVNVTVSYPPEVRLTLFPSFAIEHVTNVTLTCEVEHAFPEEVTSVLWLRDGQLFNETTDLILAISHPNRTMHGNYSCQAKNAVGWGNASDSLQLNILYTPGQATILYDPSLVVKGEAVTLLCDVEDKGNPPVQAYQWKRGEFLITDVHTANWTIKEANLEAQNEYICFARNSAGEGNPGRLSLHVNAPPSIIGPMLPFHGALETSTDVSLICQVECSPRCTIDWLRNDVVLHVGDITADGSSADSDVDFAPDDNAESDSRRLYSIKVSHLPANPRTNHFSSVVSMLRFNMTNWPDGKLDRTKDAANYTCRSSSNIAGPGVSSVTVFHVEYPPENIKLTSHRVGVIEGERFPPVGCQAKADPIESYVWIYDGNVVSSSSVLSLNFSAPRDRSGLYTCTVSNLHGNISASVFLDILYVPKCELTSHIEEGIGTVLICTGRGNPSLMSFEWFLDNSTVTDSIFQNGLVSRLTNVKPGGHYTCVANNTVGQSGLCSVELAGGEGALIAGFSDNRILIVIIVVAAVIILAIIMCIIFILVMRRRKYLGKSDKQRQSEIPLGGVADGDRAFYENLPFHGLQPAPNKNMERPVPAPRDYSPTKMRHIYQNLLLPLRSSKTNVVTSQSVLPTERTGGGVPSASGSPTNLPPPPPPPPTSSPPRNPSARHNSREGVVYADLALSNAGGSGSDQSPDDGDGHAAAVVINRRDRPTEYAVLTFCRDNTASEV